MYESDGMKALESNLVFYLFQAHKNKNKSRMFIVLTHVFRRR